MSDIQKLLGTKVHLPPGVTIEYGGMYQTQQESFTGLLLFFVLLPLYRLLKQQKD